MHLKSLPTFQSLPTFDLSRQTQNRKLKIAYPGFINQTLPGYALVGALLITISIPAGLEPPDGMNPDAKVAYAVLLHTASE